MDDANPCKTLCGDIGNLSVCARWLGLALTMKSIALSLVVTLSSVLQGFYLPGVAPRTFKDGESVNMKVSSRIAQKLALEGELSGWKLVTTRVPVICCTVGSGVFLRVWALSVAATWGRRSRRWFRLRRLCRSAPLVGRASDENMIKMVKLHEV